MVIPDDLLRFARTQVVEVLLVPLAASSLANVFEKLEVEQEETPVAQVHHPISHSDQTAELLVKFGENNSSWLLSFSFCVSGLAAEPHAVRS